MHQSRHFSLASGSALIVFLFCAAVVPSMAQTVVEIPDLALREAVSLHLDIPGDQITTEDMSRLTGLEAQYKSISNLAGLEAATNLTVLYLGGNAIADLAPLSGLINLTALDLGWNEIVDLIVDLAPLSGLINLTELALGGNAIADLAPLSGLINLTALDLGWNEIVDLAPLSGLINLTELALGGNAITNLAPLVANEGLDAGDVIDVRYNPLSEASISTHIPTLTDAGIQVVYSVPVEIPDPALRDAVSLQLDIPGDQITTEDMSRLTTLIAQDKSISNLAGLEAATNLTYLDLYSNGIADLAPLSGLTNLTRLVLGGNAIADLAPLSGLINLTALDLGGNAIADLAPLSGLINLTSLDLASNAITDITALSGLTNLGYLSLGGNAIADLAPLSGLTNLTKLYLASNAITNLAPLVANKGLDAGDYIDVRYNPLSEASISTHIPTLTDAGIQVVYSESEPPPDVVYSERPLYWIERGETLEIRQAQSDTPPRIDSVVTAGLRRPNALALDVENRKVYWIDADSTVKGIRRANLDGTSVEDLVTTGLTTPNGIALDVAGGKMYWTDWATTTIHRANLDGTGVEDLVTNSRSLLGGIALDVAGGKMYWVDFGTDTIRRANLDGTGMTTLVTDGLKGPFDIALDEPDGKIYWVDTATHKIQRANLDGSNVEDILTRSKGIDNPNGIALDLENGVMYWTESSAGKGKIKRANLDGSNVRTLFTDLDHPRGIAIDTESLPPDPESPPTTQPDAPSISEDVNDDGVVDVNDILVVVANFGVTGKHAADVNGDGVVTIDDIAQVALAFDNGAAAPVAREEALDVVTPERVREWIAHATLSGESPDAIRALEQLLASLTPKQTLLLANYPNPFNPETWIPYQLANPADVTLRIHAVDGSLVRTVSLGHQPAGIYQSRSRAVYWDGKNAVGEPVASGIYFYTLTAGEFSATRRMLILK